MKTKYTPGPWKAVPNGAGYYEIRVAQKRGGRRIHEYDPSIGMVVENVNYPHTKGANDANAMLIAAAPAMLEAIELAIMYLEDGAPLTAMDRLRAAAWKAKGDT